MCVYMYWANMYIYINAIYQNMYVLEICVCCTAHRYTCNAILYYVINVAAVYFVQLVHVY
jgi:hypothetical protein